MSATDTLKVPTVAITTPIQNDDRGISLSNLAQASTSSLDISSLPMTSDRIRRRSELQRTRPTNFGVSTAALPESIELPVLAPLKERDSPELATPDICATASGIVHNANNIDATYWNQKGDVENIADSLPTSVAPSIRLGVDDDTTSDAPVVSASQKATHRWKGRLHFAALCYAFFLEGWNDGSTGPLLPSFQEHYNIGFAIVSILFVLNTIGFISGAMGNVYLNDRFGFGKVLVIGAVCQLIAYVLLSPAGPFPIMCIAFGFAGFGISLQNAQANGFVGSLRKNASTKMGLLHASYGLGAFIAPLVATHFSTSRHWSFHYLISAGISVTNIAVLSFVFRFQKQDDVMAEAGQAAGEAGSNQNKYRQILGLRTVQLLSVWALIYVGVEVTLGGWIVTFIQQKRGGGASAGYISSGFFGGLMLGRLALMWLNKKVGERRIMFFYGLLAIQFEVTIWVVPSLVENAVAVACIGVLLGPMYPILMNYCTDTLPKWLLTGCVGWIAGVGQAGSAVLPFATGMLASKFGIGSLQPLLVSMMSTMIVIWAFVPRARRVD